MTTTRRTLGFLAVVIAAAACVTVSAHHAEPVRYYPASFVAMSGTFELEATRGDDPRRAAERATRDLPRWQRDRAYYSLLNRLEPPRMLAIDRHGRTFTIASSSGPRTTFEIDARDRYERNERGWRGRDITTHATVVGDRLSIWTEGDRETDFRVTFQSVDRGRGVFVTRRFDSDDLRTPVTIASYYRRVASVPRWDLYTPVRVVHRRPVVVGVPDGTRMVAVLDTALSTQTARSGARFSMTVRNPGEYQGARIDGVVERVTPYGRGRNADMRVVFDRIRLRNGREFDFDAILESVRTPGGKTVRVDASGKVPDPDGAGETAGKGAIGAALGAAVGAIIGGGKGAAVGAVIGGVGGVIVAQSGDEALDLPPGTVVTVVVAPERDR